VIEPPVDLNDRYDRKTGTWRDPAFDATPLHWVIAFPRNNHHETPCVTYGNEPSLGFAYGNIALIVTIEDIQKRARPIADSE